MTNSNTIVNTAENIEITNAILGSEAETPQYAGFWRRLAALLIDLVIVYSIHFIVGLILGVILLLSSIFIVWPSIPEKAEDIIYRIIGFIVFLLFYAVFESSSKQGTPGKMALGIIVTDLNNNRITFGKAIARNSWKLVSIMILGLGYIIAVFTEKKQALHDISTNCLVVKKKKIHLVVNGEIRMTFTDLIDFIENKMTMSHIYQPLLIRSLVDAGGTANPTAVGPRIPGSR